MKRAVLERNLVVVLFILVLVIFSFAERDTKRMEKIYKASHVPEKQADKALVKTTEQQAKERN